MKTTLYNHKVAGDGKKPLAPNVVVKTILFLLKNNCVEEAFYLESHYSFIPHQESIIEATKSLTVSPGGR